MVLLTILRVNEYFSNFSVVSLGLCLHFKMIFKDFLYRIQMRKMSYTYNL